MMGLLIVVLHVVVVQVEAQFRFQPRNSIEHLQSFSSISTLLICAQNCNLDPRCRTFDYDENSEECRLFEGQFNTGTTIFSNSRSKVGAILYFEELFDNKFNESCDQCENSR